VAKIGIGKQNLPSLLPMLELMPVLGKKNGAFKEDFSRNIEIFSDNFDRLRIKKRVFFYRLKIAADYFKIVIKAKIYIYNRDPDLIIKF